MEVRVTPDTNFLPNCCVTINGKKCDAPIQPNVGYYICDMCVKNHTRVRSFCNLHTGHIRKITTPEGDTITACSQCVLEYNSPESNEVGQKKRKEVSAAETLEGLKKEKPTGKPKVEDDESEDMEQYKLWKAYDKKNNKHKIPSAKDFGEFLKKTKDNKPSEIGEWMEIEDPKNQ